MTEFYAYTSWTNNLKTNIQGSYITHMFTSSSFSNCITSKVTWKEPSPTIALASRLSCCIIVLCRVLIPPVIWSHVQKIEMRQQEFCRTNFKSRRKTMPGVGWIPESLRSAWTTQQDCVSRMGGKGEADRQNHPNQGNPRLQYHTDAISLFPHMQDTCPVEAASVSQSH